MDIAMIDIANAKAIANANAIANAKAIAIPISLPIPTRYVLISNSHSLLFNIIQYILISLLHTTPLHPLIFYYSYIQICINPFLQVYPQPETPALSSTPHTPPTPPTTTRFASLFPLFLPSAFFQQYIWRPLRDSSGVQCKIHSGIKHLSGSARPPGSLPSFLPFCLAPVVESGEVRCGNHPGVHAGIHMGVHSGVDAGM